MKKIGLIIVCLLISLLFFSACKMQPASPIKYERKLEKYLKPEKKPAGTIDLSDGPKLRYDASFGPKDLSFDVKIVNPY